MAPSRHLLLLAVLAAAAVSLAAGEVSPGAIGFDLHHRFSPVVRRWAEARGHPGAWWPDAGQGSPEYYSALSRHDRALLSRRALAGAGDGDGLLTFAPGNDTYRLSSLGFLHYSIVTVGTPNVTFLVALDTGSDLFWVPCDCKRCASINSTELPLHNYSPTLSSTSKKVTCNSNLCDRPNACATAGSSCPYAVHYVSANTSSSGVLVEDLLYLTREGSTSGTVKAPIVFGCGQVQTGAFIDGAAPDGLLGLGMENISVPSVLANTGLTSNTFSMCFSDDGQGRINFGDGGSRNQSETPFLTSHTRPTYNISITAINIDKKTVQSNFTAVVDSGTSFTYLNDPAYTDLSANFNAQIREKRVNLSASVPFEYCYGLSPNQTNIFLPDVSLTTKGGAAFPVTRSFIVIANQQDHPIGYCLALLKSDIPISIIGQNFMTGLKVVFDRERSILGWQQFDCYKNVSTQDLPDGSPASAPGPGPVPFRPHDTEAMGSPPSTAEPVARRPSSSSPPSIAVGGASSLMLALLFAAAIL